MTTATRQCSLKSCRIRFRRETGIVQGLKAWCCFDHQVEHANQIVQAMRKRKEKQKHARQKRDFYERDVPHLLKVTQAAVNKLVKLLDAGKPCISCGRPDEGGRKRNASHLKSVGANSALRFDLRNIHDACVVCNQYQSGNIQGYRERLLIRYGTAMLDYLDSAPRLRKWTPEELKTIRAEAQAEIRRLEKGLPPSRDWRALDNELERKAA